MTNFVQQTPYFAMLTPEQRNRLLNSQAFKQMATVDALFKTASDMRSGIDTGTEDGRKLISEFAKTLGGEVSFLGGVPVLEYNGQSFPLNDPRVLQAVRQEALNQFKAEADSQLTINRMLNSPDVTESTIGTVCSKYADLYGVSAGQALARVKDIMVNGLDGKGRPVEDQAYFMLNRMAQHLNESMIKGMKINPANYEQAGQLLQMIGYRVDNPEAATAAEWRFSKIDEPTTLPLTLEQMTQMVSINDRISREIATDYMKMRESAEKAQAEWRKGEQDRIAKEEKDQEKRDIEMLSNMYGEKFIPLTPKDQDTMRAVWNNSVKLAQKRGIFDKNGDPVPVTKGNIERFKETDRDWKKVIERIGLNPDDFYSPVENVLLVYELKELEAELDKLPLTVNDKSVPAIGAVGGVYPGRGEIRNPKRVQK